MNVSLPRPDERLLVTGPTGSGKSELMKNVVRYYANVTWLDFKGDTNLSDRPHVVAYDLPSLVKAWNEHAEDGMIIVYKVPAEQKMPSGAAALDEIPRIALTHRMNTILYYDDVSYVATGQDFWKRAPWFYRCQTSGRSLNVVVWMSAQRPAWIPRTCLTESDYRATFYLRDSNDRRQMEDLISEDIDWVKLRKWRYSFIWSNDYEITPVTRLELPSKAQAA